MTKNNNKYIVNFYQTDETFRINEEQKKLLDELYARELIGDSYGDTAFTIMLENTPDIVDLT